MSLNGLNESNAWQALRQVRDEMLRKTDWTQLADAQLSLSMKNQYKVYRQSLRDLPSVTVDPENPVWPEEPSE